MKVVDVIKYGARVKQNVFTDKLRKTECLCLNCKYFPCEISQKFYDLCVKHNTAIMMTRCPDFEPKEKEAPTKRDWLYAFVMFLLTLATGLSLAYSIIFNNLRALGAGAIFFLLFYLVFRRYKNK